MSVDACLAGIMDEAKAKFGEDRIYTGKESEARLVGLSVPALSMRYLLQSNILPLSRAVQITGTQESCKSSFLYEIYRWIRCNGGRSYHIENESKDSDALRLSILNYDHNASELFVSDSLEEWQKYLTWLTDESVIKAQLLGTKDKPGPGKSVPIGFGVDSLTAKSSLEVQTGVEERGFADRVHPVDALKLSSYLKCLPQRLVGWPFIFLCTNHLKPQKGPTGAIDYHTPGGYSIKFQETFEIRMKRIADIDSGDNGVMIQFVTQKNSIGPGRKSIKAAFRWYFDQNMNGRQVSYWDWNAATVALLDEFKGGLRGQLEDICDIHTKSAGGKKAWSKVLGVPSDDPQPYGVVGALLETRADLMTNIHKVLGVREYSVFKAGVDYRQQLKDATLAIESAEGYAPVASADEPEVD